MSLDSPQEKPDLKKVILPQLEYLVQKYPNVIEGKTKKELVEDAERLSKLAQDRGIIEPLVLLVPDIKPPFLVTQKDPTNEYMDSILQGERVPVGYWLPSKSELHSFAERIRPSVMVEIDRVLDDKKKEE